MYIMMNQLNFASYTTCKGCLLLLGGAWICDGTKVRKIYYYDDDGICYIRHSILSCL